MTVRCKYCNLEIDHIAPTIKRSSVIDRAVRNSPPPMDDVGGDVDFMLDEKDPQRAPPVSPAAAILQQAAKIIEGDRAAQHGPKERNHQNIAILWNAFMELKRINAPPGHTFDDWDVATMMELLKLARRFTGFGRTNPDNYVDGAGYCSIAGEIAGATFPMVGS